MEGDHNLSHVIVPPPEATWNDISEFALSYNGYENFGTNPQDSTEFPDLPSFANAALEIWERNGTLPDSLHLLRCALFFEQRRSGQGFPFDFNPDDEWSNPRSEYIVWITYVKALLQAINDSTVQE